MGGLCYSLVRQDGVFAKGTIGPNSSMVSKDLGQVSRDHVYYKAQRFIL